MELSRVWVEKRGSRVEGTPHDAEKLPKSSIGEERFTYRSSWGMTEEQGNKWLKYGEPRVVVEGGSSKTTGGDSRGMCSKGLTEDDR